MITEISQRSREIMRLIVEAYTETGSAVGSRTLSRRLELPVSPATVRNAMADLEEIGLLYSPHTSAGRLPTEAGLRMFVDGLLEVGNLTEEERTELWRTVRLVQQVVMSYEGCDACKLGVQDGLAAGQSVPHVHVHVLPQGRSAPG